jgi:membrane dipeptidase
LQRINKKILILGFVFDLSILKTLEFHPSACYVVPFDLEERLEKHIWINALLVIIFPFVAGCRDNSPEALKLTALKIHDRILTVDTHTDTPLNLLREGWDIGKRHETGVPGSGRIDLPRMRKGGLDAAFFAAYVRQGERTEDGYRRARERTNVLIDAIDSVAIKYPDRAGIGLAPDDPYTLEKQGKRTIFIGMENGYPLGKDPSLLKTFYDRGVRYITLCHTKNNDLCDSSTDEKGPEWNGLSPFGEKVVDEMNRLGIIIDVSHISDDAFQDVLERTKAPVIASHSCCRAVFDSPRNLSDDMLRALAKNGGVIQINLCSFYLKETRDNPEQKAALDSLKEARGDLDAIRDEKTLQEYLNAYFDIMDRYPSDLATVTDLADHIDHAVRIAGIDHVGIGSDFDGGAELADVTDVSDYPNITLELVRRGYSEKDIRKIWGGNFMRVFREVIRIEQTL